MFFVSLTGTQDYISFNLAGPEMVMLRRHTGSRTDFLRGAC